MREREKREKGEREGERAREKKTERARARARERQRERESGKILPCVDSEVILKITGKKAKQSCAKKKKTKTIACG